MAGRKDIAMYKQWAVVFQNVETKRVKMDVFMGRTAREANADFFECYRHGVYTILSTTEIPE